MNSQRRTILPWELFLILELSNFKIKCYGNFI
nr:MAG TPA: hypothetical protein [Caudoviricetes sp.]